jgi:hypothetical protein
MKTAIVLLVLMIASSCAQVRSVSQTSIPTKKDKVVKAEVKNNIFFLLNFSTTYINDLTTQLQNSCPNGRVEGILTKDVFITYFPIIFHREHITAEGYCVQ